MGNSLGGWDGLRPYREPEGVFRSTVNTPADTIRKEKAAAELNELQHQVAAEIAKYEAVGGALLAPVSRSAGGLTRAGSGGRLRYDISVTFLTLTF